MSESEWRWKEEDGTGVSLHPSASLSTLEGYPPRGSNTVLRLKTLGGLSLWRGTEQVAPAGAPPPRGKICPTCGGRFDGVAAFCGKDGTQLVLLN